MKPKKLLLVLLLCHPLILSSQIRKGFGGEVGIYDSEYGSFMAHTSLTYNWLVSRSFSVSLGGMIIYSKIDDLSGWKTAEASYNFDDENIVRLNLLSTATYTLPIFRKTGIYGSASVYFEPIPFSYISLDKSTKTDPVIVSEGKYAFTRFSPGAFVDLGFYHDFIRNNHILKLFLGFGCGWYDPLADYRNTKIDGQELSPRIPDKKNFFRITLKVMGF